VERDVHIAMAQGLRLSLCTLCSLHVFIIIIFSLWQAKGRISIMPGEYESVGLLSPYPTRVIYLCVN
jgi:hypothetical protein